MGGLNKVCIVSFHGKRTILLKGIILLKESIAIKTDKIN